jgi:hypothetical protein
MTARIAAFDFTKNLFEAFGWPANQIRTSFLMLQSTNLIQLGSIYPTYKIWKCLNKSFIHKANLHF